MKRISIIVVLMVFSMALFGQKGEALYALSEDEVIPNCQYIDANFVDSSSPLTPYVLRKVDTLFTSDLDGSIYQLRQLKFNGYDGEPGICNVIDILRNGSSVLKMENSNGYASISSYVPTETGDYTFVSLGAETHILIFNEWIYASQPSMVSIIVLHKNCVKLVYNKPMFIRSISKKAGLSLTIQLQSNTVEYGGIINNPVEMDTPDFHSIWWDGRVLRYQ
ncbi:MAG TPA: hypothetical protein VJ871_03365 [Bacteroidales bacterium]|nr:hypothetical protein [Bacteroidales bacterium]